MATSKLPAPLPICKECLAATAGNNNNGKRGANSTTTNSSSSAAASEKLSRCNICGAALHHSCAPAELALLVDRGATWSCDDCSPRCSGCQTDRESQNYLVKCAACIKCYHPSCLDPGIDKKSKAPWRCRHCQTTHTPKNDTTTTTTTSSARKHKGQDNHHQQSDITTTPTSARKKINKIRENRK